MDPKNTTPAAEVILRVRLADGLTSSDLEGVSRVAELTGSLESAIATLIKRGLARLTPTPKKKGGKAK
jgi:hypothetical protein